MKASLLAITISSVLAAPTFAAPYQVDVELANQQTLQLIDGQMKAVDASVQYKLNEQYANATPGTTATLDDVAYEKQSNGTWAAVGAASAALVAGLLSSSSSSSSSDNGNTIPELPVTTSMDSVGTWKVADNDSGYIVTLAGQEVYVDSSNVTLNNDGTATIVVNDRKLIVGINGDELYRVDQVSHPDLDIPDWGDTPDFGNGIIGEGWTRVDIGAGVQDFYRFEKVTEDGVKTVEVNDQRKHDGGVHISVNGGDWKHFDGSKIAAAKDFIDEHIKPADMPQLSDPEYGNGIVGEGWTRVDIGAGVQDFYRFEKVTEDGVKTVEVNDQRKHDGGVHISINGGDWKHFDGSKVAAAKDFIDEHLRPADMPQLSDPEYGNGIVGEGWTRVEIGAGVQDFYRFEKVTEDGVKTVEVNDQRKHDGGVHVSVNGGDWKHFDGSKVAAAKDFIDEHLRPADMPQLSDPEYGNGIVGEGWTRVEIGAGVQDFYRFEKVTEDGVKTVEVNDQRKHDGGVHVSINGGDWKHFDGSKITAAKDFIDEHLKPADMPQLSDPEYGNGIVGEGWTRVDIGADVQDFYRFEKVTEDGVKTVEVNDQRKHGGGVHVSVNGGDWKHFDGSRIAAAKDFIAEHLKPADMPQLSDPEYGNGIVGEGWTRVDIGAGVEGYYKFENITEDGVGQAAVQVNKNVHGDITSVTISGNTVDGTEFDKDFDGSKISNIKDFIDEHLKPADVTLPPTVKNNVKDKVQSIDPAKLQKAKSAIQQRLRG